MADAFLIVDEPAVTDKRLDTERLTVAGQSVDRERIQVTGAGDVEVSAVKNAAQAENTSPSYALLTRPILRRYGEVLSTTPLGISGIFTQTSRDGNEDGVTFVAAAARADQASAANGFEIQEYDGADDDFTDTNFIRTAASVSVLASTTTYLYAVIRGRKWRVRYTNGGTGQTSFKLTAAATNFPIYALDSSGRQIVVNPTAADLQVTVGAALPAGTNNIGDVDVLTLPALPAGTNNIGDVDVASIAAGDNNIGNVDVLTLPALPAGSNKIGAVDLDSDAAIAAAVPTVGQFIAGTDGTNARGLKTDTAGELQVDVLTLPALPAGTNNIGDVDVLTLPALPAGTNNIGDVDVVSMPTGASAAQVQGTVAHDSAAAQNPVQVGANARTTNPTAVTDNDVVRILADKLGKLLSGGWAPRELRVTNTITLSTTTETTLVAAGAAGVFHDLVALLLSNTSATAVRVDFRDSTAGTVRFAIYVPAGETRGVSFAGVAWPQTTAANNWTAQLSAAVTDVRIAAVAIKDV